MSFHKSLIEKTIHHPRVTIVLAAALFVVLGAQIPRLTVDTDPENMLPSDQPARVFHNHAKEQFDLHDMLVVGVINESHPNGVFNAASLSRIYELTRHVENIEGVIRRDVMSLASVDNITQDGPGVVRFDWLLAKPPVSDEDALSVRDAARRLPAVNGTLVSEDGRAAAIYVPLEEKSLSHRVATDIETFVGEFAGNDEFHITGLPVAEDTFGIEMFKQMGVSAPIAGMIVFLLMLFFFRSLALVTAPMIVAIATVSTTMGALISAGFTVHIMSSMIPIFLMPIAVVDSIHILSEFADLYPVVKDRKKTIRLVMDDLFQPMLYTSLTSAAGFASLALAPIPPVRVFGVFVAIGIGLAFLLTITFIPAYIVLLSDRRIAALRVPHDAGERRPRLASFLASLGPVVVNRSKLIIGLVAVVIAVSVVGITKIQINDNPLRWFRDGHSIRVADRVLNEHFAGTYDAYLVLSHADGGETLNQVRRDVDALVGAVDQERRAAVTSAWQAIWADATAEVATLGSYNVMGRLLDGTGDAYDDSDVADETVWENILNVLESAQANFKTFQRPESLDYVADVQQGLLESGLVGKSTSLVDIVKTVHRELREGDDEHFTIPETAAGVAQTLLSYQSSHRPHDLWHFTTPDHRGAIVWVQLKSGDNQDMAKVTKHIDEFVTAHPLPAGVSMDWAGLTHLNVVWQDSMVGGMSDALLGSFVIVFVMMLILFRNLWFAILAMLPLSVTIAFVYGLIGLVGKDYDMPVAVLSSLTLGLSVDFAIHFLERSRAVFKETQSFKETVRHMFNEPARAITRNAIVISVGFLPLLASPLVPYNTVGFFLAAIMLVSSVVTLMLLPSVMSNLQKLLFRGNPPGPQSHELVTEAGRRGIAGSASLVLAVTLVAAGTLHAQTPDVASIVARANNASYYAGEDGRAQVRMTISDGKGGERRRVFTMLRRDHTDGGDQDYAVLFTRPADVRGTVFLVKKHVDGDDDRWLYLPDLDLVKRIAAGDKRTSFVGSHFYYEDVSGRRLDADTHELIETTGEHFVVRNRPAPGESVEFVEWTAWIDKGTFVPMKMEYTDGQGVYRRIEVLATETIEGFTTVTRMKVSDLRSGGSTVSEFRNIDYNLDVPENIFSERTLRNPSREWFNTKSQ